MLALIGSLVATGGAVQGIARKGVFYASLGQPAVAYRVTRRLFECGVVIALAVGLLASLEDSPPTTVSLGAVRCPLSMSGLRTWKAR